MAHVLVDSCSECQQVCCKTGPGPYKILSPEDYLENYNLTEAYNTKCAALTSRGRCSVWGTKDFPIACRVHVCTNRKFTKEELWKIEQVEDRACSNCGASYVLLYHDKKLGHWIEECENCRHNFGWEKVYYEYEDR